LRKRIESVQPWIRGSILAPEKIVDALELLLKPGDRVVLEGDNQKQADFLSRSLVQVDPKKLQDLHLIISSISRPEHLSLFELGTLVIVEAAAFHDAVGRRHSSPAWLNLVTSPSPLARLRITLAAIGRAAETAMLHVTNGSNAHRGAIWTLGLLAASASINQYNLDACAITRTEDSHVSRRVSHGQTVAKKFGVSGARGEAMEGSPHIIQVGLPMLRARRAAS
jgi:hypothetical protein